MQTVGVEAVVEGLSAFIRDTGKLNSALDGIRPKGTMLQRVFSGVTETLGAFGREILNVAEYALGHLLADAIQWVVQQLGELIKATIQAGAEFQTMELRLNRLNFNSLIESGDTFKQAMTGATEATKEQMVWLQRLAVTTPYDAADIANVFTLARSYGFASEQAKRLTEDISNFAAGMGLGNTEIERIIVNFGQMVQQGKVTQRELNDLARGAFVPVNDIVKKMAQNVAQLSKEDLTALSRATGISEDALIHMADGTAEANKTLSDFRATAASVPAFMEAFSQVVETRFTGAAEDMARTFQGATDNAKDLIKSLIGFGVVRPVLNKIGGAIADLINRLTDEKNWEKLTGAAQRVGDALARIFQDLFRKMPGSDALADGIIAGLEKLASWLNSNRGKISKFFDSIGQAIQTKVLPFINKIVERFNLIRAWVNQNGETIRAFFSALGNILGQVFGIDIGGGGDFLANFLGAVTGFMEYVIANQDAIARWAEIIFKAFVAFQVLATILTVVGGIIVGVIGFVLGLVAAIMGVISVVSAVIAVLSVPFVAVVAVVVAAIGFVISIFLLAVSIIYYFRDSIANMVNQVLVYIGSLSDTTVMLFTFMLSSLTGILTSLVLTVLRTVAKVKLAFTDQPWGGIGRDIIDGVRKGVMHAAAALAAAAVAVVNRAIAAAKRAAGIASPSKEGVFIGDMFVQGIVRGIEKSMVDAEGAMQAAVKAMAMPAMALPALSYQYAVSAPAGISNTYQNTNNFNLNINSGAPVEPVISDFNMMKSLLQ